MEYLASGSRKDLEGSTRGCLGAGLLGRDLGFRV